MHQGRVLRQWENIAHCQALKMNLELSYGYMGVGQSEWMKQFHEATWVYLIREKEDDRMGWYRCHSRVRFVAKMPPSWLCWSSRSGFDKHKDILSSLKGHQTLQRADHRHRRHSALWITMNTSTTTRERRVLTNHVLDNYLDCTQRHITARNLVCSPCAPFVRRYRL